VAAAQARAEQTGWKPKPYRRITTEEAWTTPEIAAASGAGAVGGTITPYRKVINDRLLDVGEGRLKIMDEYGISMQVLSSNGPSLQNLESNLAQKLTLEFNDRMAQVIRKHPTPFAGLAGVAPQNPGAACERDRPRAWPIEVERRVYRLPHEWRISGSSEIHANFRSAGAARRAAVSASA